MKRKWLIASILIVAEIALCAGIIFAAWMGVRQVESGGLRVRVLHFDRFSAEGDEEWRFSPEGPANLVVDASRGDIQVTGGEGDEIVVQAHKTAWDSSRAKAEAALSEMAVSVTQEGDTVYVRFEGETEVLVIGSMRGDRVNFTISVPAETRVSASTDMGSLALSGTRGDADLHPEFGDIEVTDVEGSLEARTGNGEINAEGIQAGTGKITIESEFGEVYIEEGAADDIEAHSSSGSVNLREVEASGEVLLTSEFGSIEYETGSAALLSVDTGNGSVKLTDLSVSGALTAHSEFGDITLVEVSADGYDLSTSSGGITVEGASGAIKVRSGFGDLEISGAEEVDLDMETDNGSIEFAGTLGDGPHTLKSEFGNIRVILPEESALTIDLETGFGRVKSDFPVTLSGGMEEKHWSGTINGGGTSLTAETSSGDITLSIQKP